GGIVAGDQPGVTGDRAGQGLLLLALLLVAAVEQIAFELGMSGEHAPVEVRGDPVDGATDDRQRGADQVQGRVIRAHDWESRQPERGSQQSVSNNTTDGSGD